MARTAARTSPYTDQWRAAVRAGAQSSAAVLVPLVVEQFHPRTVVDVGAGEGWFCKAFETAGVKATGVDGPWVDDVLHVDFAKPPYPVLGPYDMAVCLEVAEHVDARHADRLVAWLCSLAPIVVFSAAIPGQGGTGHVNEQWQSWWAALFSVLDRHPTTALRNATWDDERICVWYRQNIVVYTDTEVSTGALDVVHPELWSMYRRPARR